MTGTFKLRVQILIRSQSDALSGKIFCSSGNKELSRDFCRDRSTAAVNNFLPWCIACAKFSGIVGVITPVGLDPCVFGPFEGVTCHALFTFLRALYSTVAYKRQESLLDDRGDWWPVRYLNLIQALSRWTNTAYPFGTTNFASTTCRVTLVALCSFFFNTCIPPRTVVLKSKLENDAHVRHRQQRMLLQICRTAEAPGLRKLWTKLPPWNTWVKMSRLALALTFHSYWTSMWIMFIARPGAASGYENTINIMLYIIYI